MPFLKETITSTKGQVREKGAYVRIVWQHGYYATVQDQEGNRFTCDFSNIDISDVPGAVTPDVVQPAKMAIDSTDFEKQYMQQPAEPPQPAAAKAPKKTPKQNPSQTNLFGL